MTAAVAVIFSVSFVYCCTPLVSNWITNVVCHFEFLITLWNYIIPRVLRIRAPFQKWEAEYIMNHVMKLLFKERLKFCSLMSISYSVCLIYTNKSVGGKSLPLQISETTGMIRMKLFRLEVATLKKALHLSLIHI